MKKLKIGNKVRVKSLAWYNKNKEYAVFGYRIIPKGYDYVFNDAMSKFCGKKLTINAVYTNNGKLCYSTEENNFTWCDFMLDLNEQLEFDFGEENGK